MKTSAIISITMEIPVVRTADRDAAKTAVLDAAAEDHGDRKDHKDQEEFLVQWVR